MREERTRREHPAREAANREGIPCSYEDLYKSAQQEIKQHQAEAAEYCLHPDQQEQSNADEELVSRWHDERVQAKLAHAERVQADWQHFRDASK